MKFLLALVAITLTVSGCATVPPLAGTSVSATFPKRTATQLALNELPPPTEPIAVAVYAFADETGQFRPSANGQTLSRAVTQGGASILIRALQDAGSRKWFTIVEREQIRNLLNERQIIADMRQRYLGETNVNPQALPALLFAGVLLEGGIISYDTNTLTGGAGAALLGISTQAQYRQDVVTVYMRAVSVRTGEVLTTVTSSKTITSVAVDLNVFRYVSADKLLESETGFTTNEPGQVALQQAIEKVVYALVMDGVDLHLWNFADSAAGAPLLDRYHAERDGLLSAAQVEKAAQNQRHRQAVTQKRAGTHSSGTPTAQTPLPPPLAVRGRTPASSAPANAR